MWHHQAVMGLAGLILLVQAFPAILALHAGPDSFDLTIEGLGEGGGRVVGLLVHTTLADASVVGSRHSNPDISILAPISPPCMDDLTLHELSRAARVNLVWNFGLIGRWLVGVRC